MDKHIIVIDLRRNHQKEQKKVSPIAMKNFKRNRLTLTRRKLFKSMEKKYMRMLSHGNGTIFFLGAMKHCDLMILSIINDLDC